MSRNRKPVDMQRKHLTANERLNKQEEEKSIVLGKEQLKRIPKWLVNDEAKKEYKRIIKEFEKIDVIGNLDLNNIVGYCNSFALYRQATEEMRGQPLTIKKTAPNGSINICENPLIKVQKNYADEMRKFAGLVGLTIDSRLKIATVKITKREEEVIDEFGDI